MRQPALPTPAEFSARTLRIGVGDRLERELLLEAFEAAGYERADTVVEVGQWSVRGGIVDVFVPSHASPVRLEFYRDESSGCSEELVMRDFGIARRLPAFQTTGVEFTPEEAGEYTFTCGMGMLRGRVVVEG